MRENIVFIGLGSNLGERESMLHAAAEALQPEVQPIASSHIYETPPWGFLEQPPFLNQVIQARTTLSAQATLEKLKLIEKHMGRIQNFRYGPRAIDLDILFFNDEIIESDGLTVPHPELPARAFVLIPLQEIAPELVHPVLKKTVREMAEELDCSEISLYCNENENAGA